jgi:uncharacterized membrane protein YciS (DUF1049 family)
MSRKTASARKRAESEDTAHQPTTLTLVIHILTALISDGMAWLFIPAVAVTAFLYNNHFQNDALLAVVFIGLASIALVRGCLNWQRDLNEYQSHMALERHREQVAKSTTGCFPSRRY